jgi:hypothetical protein
MLSNGYNLTINGTLPVISGTINNDQGGLVSLFIEGLMLLMFVLSAIYGVLKIKSGNRIDFRDVESVLRNATEQRQHADLPLQQDNRICDSNSK